MWSYIGGTLLLIGSLSGIALAGYQFGRTSCRAESLEQAVKDRDAVIDDLEADLEAADTTVIQTQVDMARVQEDLAAIRRTAGSVGTQLRSALDASQMGTCLLGDPVRRVRGDDYAATAAAARDANRARDEGGTDQLQPRPPRAGSGASDGR